jgi:hypothetical protein
MREKELRIALVCYGGVSLAVYMHGITKEIWRLARASQRVHSSAVREAGAPPVDSVYAHLLMEIAARSDTDLRIIVDILAGASAGGINAIFLSHAISTGQALDPLTDLWLDSADVDALIDRDVGAISRFAKYSAVPFAWAFSARSGVDKTVEPEHRAEIRAKLANFVRAPWLSPPFGGPELTNLILNAFEAMEKGPAGDPLLPDYQPLDLFVTVTDFPRPSRIAAAELAAGGDRDRAPADPRLPGSRRGGEAARRHRGAGLRGAGDGELPRRLPALPGERARRLPRQAEAALARPRRLPRPRIAAARGARRGGQGVLIDGSVLHNAPFGPAVAALEKRPSRREVDRRFVYIDPKPGMKSVRFGANGDAEPPGFFGTIFGALSDIPREQPIRDNLETIDRMSARIRRLRRITESIRPEVEAAIERAVGSSFFLNSPTPGRVAGWRSKAHHLAAREAGYAYAAYGQLKIATVVEEIVDMVFRFGGASSSAQRGGIRRAIWRHVRAIGLTDPEAVTAHGAREDVIRFLVDLDLTFRTRRLRFVARQITETTETMAAPREEQEQMLRRLHGTIASYRERGPERLDTAARRAFAAVEKEPAAAMVELARLLDLPPLDEETDAMLSEALLALPKADRRPLLLSYLGYSYFDIATLPLLQGEGLDEFDPIKVDRISPNDAVAIRKGGAAGDPEGAAVQQLRRLLQPRLSRERLSLGPPARRRPPDRHRQRGPRASASRTRRSPR